MNFKNWLKAVEQIAPIALSATPLAAIAPYVSVGIQAAEQIPGADGPTKLAIAKSIVHIGVAATNAKIGHEALDPTAVDKLVTDGINTVVGAVNLKVASAPKE